MAEDEARPPYEQLLAERDELVRQLTFDELTGLYRDTDQGRKIALAKIRQARQGQQDVVLAKIDLRQFRDINNRYDHETGDRVLKMFADRLMEIIGEAGMGMRSHFKGDEFAALLFGVDQKMAEQKLQKLQKAGIDWTTERATGNITFTLGIAGAGKMVGEETMTDGELFQNLWQVASEKERNEHRRING